LEKTLTQLRSLQRSRPGAAKADHAVESDDAAAPDDATKPERPRSSSPASSPVIDYEAADRWLAAHPLADER
jgi:hypothetical protein